jgi:hypothetical protein
LRKSANKELLVFCGKSKLSIQDGQSLNLAKFDSKNVGDQATERGRRTDSKLPELCGTIEACQRKDL